MLMGVSPIGSAKLGKHADLILGECLLMVEDRCQIAGKNIERKRGGEGCWSYRRILTRRSIRDPEDQRHFVASVRRALADSVARGEPLPPVRRLRAIVSLEGEAAPAYQAGSASDQSGRCSPKSN